MVVFLAAAAAFLGSLALTPLARAMAWKIGAVSRPDGKRRLHARPTALGGGGAIYLALILGIFGSFALALDAGQDKLPAALGLSAGMLCLLGFYDDLFDMPARWKLLGQIVSTLPVVIVGSWISKLVLFGHTFDVGLLGIPWTIGWLVLGINALNLLDGVDGLASLLGIVIAVAVGAIAAAERRPEAMLLAFLLAGALGGFLVHNLPPARIYLGDSGSMVIGFTLALLAMRVSLLPEEPAASKVTVAAALLFVPLLDVLLAVARRAMKRSSFAVADRGHLHHQLLERGLDNWQVLGVLGGYGSVTVLVAWWVSISEQEVLGWAVLASVTAALTAGEMIACEEWRLAKRVVRRAAFRGMRWAAQTRRTARPADSPEPFILAASGQFEQDRQPAQEPPLEDRRAA